MYKLKVNLQSINGKVTIYSCQVFIKICNSYDKTIKMCAITKSIDRRDGETMKFEIMLKHSFDRE